MIQTHFPRIKRADGKVAVVLSVFILILTGSVRWTAYAAVDVPDTIRVALFLNAPANNFSSVTPVVTLQSAAGLTLTWRDAGFKAAIGAAAPGMPARFAIDGYRAIVLETADLNSAIAVLKNVQASSQAAFLTRLTKLGKPIYQVSEGVYGTAAEAAAALSRWQATGAAAGVVPLGNPRTAGPWALEAGPYGGQADAEAAAAQLGAAGLDAFAAVKPAGGALTYVVRIGQEVDAASAAALQPAATSAGALNVHAPADGEPYVLIRNDMTIYAAAGQSTPLYALPAAAPAALRADPAGAGPIQVSERGNRSYRGAMEISVFGGALALVNEVGFEQYLYSVVGAEVGAGWPPEAQKAQAVAARSYALASGAGFQIAHVVDTTRSQVYNGIGSENPNSTAGVDATAGEVLTYEGKVIEAVFSSNAGGITADNLTEGWGNNTAYMAGGIPSPDDGPQAGLPAWYDVALADGQRGYIRSDLLADAGRNAAGVKIMTVTASEVAMRVRPLIETNVEPLARLSAGTSVAVLGQTSENSAYTWEEAPMSADFLLASLNKYVKIPESQLLTLEVTGRGPSGRVTQVSVNGAPYTLKTPDTWRSALGGVRSTLLQIEETARMKIAGADGATRELPSQSGGPVQIIGADGVLQTANDTNLFVLDASGQTRVVTPEPEFRMSVKGYGHGMGMSQYGAKKLAEQGNDYRSILQYYYKNAILEKDAGG